MKRKEKKTKRVREIELIRLTKIDRLGTDSQERLVRENGDLSLTNWETD